MMEDGRGRRTEGGGGDIDRTLMSFGIEIAFGVRQSFVGNHWQCKLIYNYKLLTRNSYQIVTYFRNQFKILQTKEVVVNDWAIVKSRNDQTFRISVLRFLYLVSTCTP